MASNGAMRAPSLRSWPSRSCSTISATPRRQRASIRASCSGSSPISTTAGKWRAPTSTPRSPRCAASVPPSSLPKALTLKYDQTIRENTMSMNGLYSSRSEFDRGGLRVAKGAGTVDANAAAEEASMNPRGESRYDEVYARAARRRNMSAPDAPGEADRFASAQGARSTQAVQIANIAARLERLPLTSYQRDIFAIIATAWLFDSMDLGALTFVLGSIKQTFQLSTAKLAGLPA